MTGELHKESMDIDSPGGSKESPYELEDNGFNLYPVSANDSGEGHPYAPEDWPNPGDKWGWKVGRRIASAGYFLDRYTYLPSSLRQPGHNKTFASRLSLERYVRENYPNTNIDAFFASFSWKIPSRASKKDYKEMFRPSGETAEDLGSHVQIDGPHCKAGNRFCSSLTAGDDPVSEMMFCDMCCSEPRFCRECCCILCCRIIDKTCNGYDYITCEANVEGLACGHSCHIDCALRAYMAGTVGGTIDLDVEYYCRRCDSRTDLVSHVTELLKNCESIASRDDIEKLLKVGIRVLRGSKKANAKQLLGHIELAMSKVKNGTNLEDIWKEEAVSGLATGPSPNANGTSGHPNIEESQDCQMGSPAKLSSDFDHRIKSLKHKGEIDHILDELRKSQEIEYILAEERLTSHKNYILNLYQQLDKERSDLSRRTPSKDHDSSLDAVLNGVDEIKRELSKLNDMEEVAKGFGRVPKHILKEHFGLDVEH